MSEAEHSYWEAAAEMQHLRRRQAEEPEEEEVEPRLPDDIQILGWHPLLVPQPGMFITGMPNAAYHAAEGISNSRLSLLAKSPAHCKTGWQTATKAMRLGTAVHTAILEPHRLCVEYRTLPEGRNRTHKEYKDLIADGMNPELVLTANEKRDLLLLRQEVYRNRDAARYLHSTGWRELSVFGECDVTGQTIKCRFDLLTEGLVPVDLKKARSADYRGFSSAVATYGYHRQAAFYEYVYRCAAGGECGEMRFLAIEATAPYFNKVWRLDDLTRKAGESEIMRLLELYQQCDEGNRWPLPDGSEGYIGLPEWAIDDEEEIEL